MIDRANRDPTRRGLVLEVAFQTKDRVSLRQHLLVYGSVRLMAAQAAFPQSLVFEDMRAALGLMALHARLIFRQQGSTPAADRVSPVRLMTSTAAHSPFQHRVPVWQSKLGPQIGMTMKAALRIAIGIHQGPCGAARFDMDTGRSVTRLAAHIGRVGSVRDQPGVSRARKMFRDTVVTLLARV
jgi:hypothetical protein